MNTSAANKYLQINTFEWIIFQTINVFLILW